MIISLFDFPLPNNEERYDLSKEELLEFLQKAYDNGFEQARNIFDPRRITYTNNTELVEAKV